MAKKHYSVLPLVGFPLVVLILVGALILPIVIIGFAATIQAIKLMFFTKVGGSIPMGLIVIVAILVLLWVRRRQVSYLNLPPLGPLE